ncbi:MAG: hypothetical protein CM15mP29_0080 [Alphaproteobacteria bacterium]|nr:MAG: hypothetical protein CM15mP29_0080 [Alphaproteobacteria bacterium]
MPKIFINFKKKSNLMMGLKIALIKNLEHLQDISPEMLKDINLEMVILGHSERREYHNETSETS